MSQLSPDDTGRSADQNASLDDPTANKTVAELLGEIVWLMTQDSEARNLPIHEIERIVMPAILMRRFHIKYTKVMDMKTGEDRALQPVFVKILAKSFQNTGTTSTPTVIATFSLNKEKYT